MGAGESRSHAVGKAPLLDKTERDATGFWRSEKESARRRREGPDRSYGAPGTLAVECRGDAGKRRGRTEGHGDDAGGDREDTGKAGGQGKECR